MCVCVDVGGCACKLRQRANQDGARSREWGERRRKRGERLTSQRTGRRSRHKGRGIGQAQAQDRQHRTHGYRGWLQRRRRTSVGEGGATGAGPVCV